MDIRLFKNELRTMTLFDLQKEFSFYKEISANEETFNKLVDAFWHNFSLSIN